MSNLAREPQNRSVRDGVQGENASWGEYETSLQGRFEERFTLPRLLEEQADLRGSQVCLICECEGGESLSYTYADLLDRAGRAATVFRDCGVKAGDRVHVHLGNRVEFLDCWLGAAISGALIVPTGPGSAPDEVTYVVDHSQPVVSVAAGKSTPLLRGFRGSLKALIDVDDGDWLAGTDPSFDMTRIEPQSPLAIMYTSGTTSRPKGVIVTHANYGHVGEVMAQNLRMTPDDRWLVSLPLFHANAQYYCFMSAFMTGASVALMPRFSASKWGSQAVRHGATLSSLFAAPIRMILAKEENLQSRPETLRTTIYAQNLTTREIERFETAFGTLLLQLYGMTETIAPPIMNSLFRRKRPDGIGRPCLGVKVAVVDETGREVEQGGVGELRVFGEPGVTLMKGYWADPEATVSTLVDGNWLSTGDQVTVDEEGFYVFVDRSKDMVKRSGENVALSEVERVILDCPGVREVAVIGQPDRMYDARIHAFVVAEGHSALTEEMIMSWCRERLAKFKVPDAVTFLPSLPRTAVGKVQKRSLVGVDDVPQA